MTLIEFFIILFNHWVSDLVFQTHWQAVNKSKNNTALTNHVLVYSSVWAVLSIIYSLVTGNLYMLLFSPITFVVHWVTDYFTSRLNTKLYQKGDLHNFFVSIGFDQLLHYIQLISTYKMLASFIDKI